MARHHVSDPRVQAVIGQLIDHVIAAGSVNAVVERLNEALHDGDGKVYPNRVHGLLSDEPARSINTATLEALEEGLKRASIDTGDAVHRVRQEVERAVAAATAAGVADRNDVVRRVAEDLALPAAVVRRLTQDSVLNDGRSAAAAPAKGSGPDWSWQDLAVQSALAALRKRPDYKAGLVVPTGGGKTRIALRIMLAWLAEETRDDAVVLWVTHRHHLKLQAHRALQDLTKNPTQLPEDASAAFANRVRFSLVQSVGSVLEELGDRVSLIVVDEAHHAAASSYETIVNHPSPGLFLTATPNRADNLPIGIDEIAYTITYRELFRRGCVIEPVFHPPVDMVSLDWTHPGGVGDLADYLLAHASGPFSKVLVAVSRVERTEVLYEALLERLDQDPEHPLAADDLGFVHGANSSTNDSPSTFLDAFSARPRGILIGTSQLLGEGFDDPNIDAVVVTYPSSSISHLMQVAGRALRYAPGKDQAHIVQVHESPLEYHFEQRWLYQDISDRLRPEIVDRTYTSSEDLSTAIRSILDDHHVDAAHRQRILHELASVQAGDRLSLMLSGIHYYGPLEQFEETAKWGALLATPTEYERFVHVFNDISDRSEDIKEQGAYLKKVVTLDASKGSLYKAYVDLLEGMEYARREIAGETYAGADHRPYQPRRSSSWLRYFTFAFAPSLPLVLEEFLADAANRDAVIEQYHRDTKTPRAAVKVSLPLSGSYAYLLSESQAQWLVEARAALVAQLAQARPEEGFSLLYQWRTDLPAAPIAGLVLEHFDQLLRPERYAEQYLQLHQD